MPACLLTRWNSTKWFGVHSLACTAFPNVWPIKSQLQQYLGSTEIQQSMKCTLKLHSICADINRYNYANASLSADPLKQHKMVRCPQPRLHSIPQCVAHQITITAIPGQHRDPAVNEMYTQTALNMCRYKQVQLCQCQPVCFKSHGQKHWLKNSGPVDRPLHA